MIVFDAERLKRPNCGFYTYVNGLGKALVEQMPSHSEKLSIYIPQGLNGIFGRSPEYITQKPLDRLFLKASKGVQLWHSTHQSPHYLPGNCSRMLGTIHDMNFLHEKPLSQHKMYRKKYESFLRRMDRIVTISNFAKKDICRNLNLADKKIDVIYNGITHYEGEMVIPRYIPTSPFLLGIGECNIKRNYSSLPCLLKGTDFELVICGIIGNDFSNIENEASKCGVSSRVHFTGIISEAEKKWYLQNCFALVHPTLADGFGLPPLEAMHYGKPVFVSNRTSLPEVCGKDAFYFNSDFDREQMRNEFNAGLEIIESDKTLPDRLKERADSLTWEKAATEYWQIYEEMLEMT